MTRSAEECLKWELQGVYTTSLKMGLHEFLCNPSQIGVAWVLHTTHSEIRVEQGLPATPSEMGVAHNSY